MDYSCSAITVCAFFLAVLSLFALFFMQCHYCLSFFRALLLLLALFFNAVLLLVTLFFAVLSLFAHFFMQCSHCFRFFLAKTERARQKKSANSNSKAWKNVRTMKALQKKVQTVKALQEKSANSYSNARKKRKQ